MSLHSYQFTMQLPYQVIYMKNQFAILRKEDINYCATTIRIERN